MNEAVLRVKTVPLDPLEFGVETSIPKGLIPHALTRNTSIKESIDGSQARFLSTRPPVLAAGGGTFSFFAALPLLPKPAIALLTMPFFAGAVFFVPGFVPGFVTIVVPAEVFEASLSRPSASVACEDGGAVRFVCREGARDGAFAWALMWDTAGLIGLSGRFSGDLKGERGSVREL